LNALNRPTLGELAHARRGQDDEGARADRHRQAKAFVAGADINELAKMQPLQAKALAAYGRRSSRA
jgi:enoyl-CoA hydratase/carnithine racemase